MIDVVPNAGVIALGKQGENQAVRVTLPNIRAGSGSILLLHQRSDDQKPYPVPVVEADGGIIWTVSSTDTAYPGRGQAELQWLGTDGAVVKSVTYQTNVLRALTTPGAVPDEPLKPYTQAVAKDAQAAKDAAANATEAARSAEDSATQAGLSAENAAKTLEKLEDGIASGDFRGEKGEQGEKGDPGPQGPQGEAGPPGDTTDANAAAEAAKKAAREAQKAAEDCTGKLSELKEDLDNIMSPNLFNPAVAKVNVAISPDDGTEMNGFSGWETTDYIPVSKNDVLYFSANNEPTYYSTCAFYDAQKKFISGFGNPNNNNNITVTSDGYARFSFGTSPEKLQIEKGSRTTYVPYGDLKIKADVDNVKEDTDNIKAEVSEVRAEVVKIQEDHTNLFNKDAVVKGAVLRKGNYEIFHD